MTRSPPFLVLLFAVLASCTSPTPLPFDAENAEVTLTSGTQADAHAALQVITKFLEHWRDDEIEKALAFVIPKLRDQFQKELTRKHESVKGIKHIKSIRVYTHSRRNVLVARVGFVVAPDQEIRMDMELGEGRWMVTAL